MANPRLKIALVGGIILIHARTNGFVFNGCSGAFLGDFCGQLESSQHSGFPILFPSLTCLIFCLEKGYPMHSFHLSGRKQTTFFVALACLLAIPPSAFAKSPVKITKLEGMVDLSGDVPSPFVLEGIASHLGRYQAYGEVELLPGVVEGSLIGMGPVVFEAANGDLLVGEATWAIDSPADGGDAHIHFAWRDFVQFDDGTVVFNTGRFVEDRPPGLVVVVSTRTLVDLLILIITGH
jgi:hypothetical protein